MRVLLVGEGNIPHRLARRCKEFAEVKTCSLENTLLQVDSIRPNLVVFISSTNSGSDWKDQVTEQLPKIPADCAAAIQCASPGQLYLAGSFLVNQETRESLKLIHDLILPGTSVEEAAESIQLLGYYIDTYKKTPPTLGSSTWIQSMGANSTKSLWFKLIPRYAKFQFENPLILGETGSGKTQVAKALHALSGRSGPFVTITPRDFSSSELVQAELFGSTSGAYTGAVDKWGLVKKAEKGTLFIDELQSIDTELQGKLITFIENKSYRRIGSTDVNTADVRFIFATNRDLRELVSEGVLRDDFAWRLEGLKVNLPGLRKRKIDIPAAAAFTLAKINAERYNDSQFKVLGFTESGYRLLCDHNWPGNLRQLSNIVASMTERSTINQEALISDTTVREVLNLSMPVTLSDVLTHAAASTGENSYDNWDSLCCEFQRQIRISSLSLCNGNTVEAAKLLGTEPEKLALVKKSL